MSQIQWFPGHMLKTQKTLISILPSVDLVIQMLDSRAPYTTQNPLLNTITQNKKKLFILNKSDLSNEENLKDWLKYFKKQSESDSFSLSLSKQEERNKALKIINYHILKRFHKEIKYKGKIRAIISGVPNVGKSTLINTITQKKSAQVAKKAGLTRSFQTYQFPNYSLIDTPGLLWHKWDKETGYILAILGMIKDELLDFYEISQYAWKLAKVMNKNFETPILEMIQIDDFHQFISIFAQKRGLVKKGNHIEEEKACFLFIKEIREGKWGRLIFESPSSTEPKL